MREREKTVVMMTTIMMKKNGNEGEDTVSIRVREFERETRNTHTHTHTHTHTVREAKSRFYTHVRRGVKGSIFTHIQLRDMRDKEERLPANQPIPHRGRVRVSGRVLFDNERGDLLPHRCASGEE
jgi:hypothetical protein